MITLPLSHTLLHLELSKLAVRCCSWYSLFGSIHHASIRILIPDFLSTTLIVPSKREIPGFINPLVVIDKRVAHSHTDSDSLMFVHNGQHIQVFPTGHNNNRSHIIFHPSSIIPYFLFQHIPNPILLHPSQYKRIGQTRQ